MKPSHRTWFRIALAIDGKPGRLVAAAGEHLGAAIAAAEAHVVGSRVAGVAPANADVPLGDSVGKHAIVELGEVADELDTFGWPIGVVPQLGHRVEGAKRGYVAHPDPDASVFEAVVPRGDLVESFLQLVEKLPSADNLEVKLLDHFENGSQTDVWLTSRINAKKILGFLDDHDEELFGNGHVELGVYVRAKKATLRLTEHKTIVWIAEDRGMDADVRRWFGELDLPLLGDLATITNVSHSHYRPAKSRDRKKLGEELYRQRLRRVATEKASS